MKKDVHKHEKELQEKFQRIVRASLFERKRKGGAILRRRIGRC